MTIEQSPFYYIERLLEVVLFSIEGGEDTDYFVNDL